LSGSRHYQFSFPLCDKIDIKLAVISKRGFGEVSLSSQPNRDCSYNNLLRFVCQSTLPVIFLALTHLLLTRISDLKYNIILKYGGELDSTEVMRQRLHAEVPSSSLNKVDLIKCRFYATCCLNIRHAVSLVISCGALETSTSRIAAPVCFEPDERNFI